MKKFVCPDLNYVDTKSRRISKYDSFQGIHLYPNSHVKYLFFPITLFPYLCFNLRFMAKKLSLAELNRMSIPEFKKAPKIPVIIVLDNIRSLSNIGSIFRTADAFRIEAIYLCGVTAQPPHREIHKTALGATESVNWLYFKTTNEAVNNLISNNFKIISIEQVDNSQILNDFYPNPKEYYALIFGNEVHGVDDDIIALSDTCIEIPQHGTKHSFNVSVSVGIILWDIVLKLK